jgi:hypothetical protein
MCWIWDLEGSWCVSWMVAQQSSSALRKSPDEFMIFAAHRLIAASDSAAEQSAAGHQTKRGTVR